MHLEWCRDTLLRCQQTCQVGINLTNLIVGAGNGYAVTVGRTGRAASKVIALVRREDEQGVALIDAVVRQARKELPKSRVVSRERGDVACLSGAISGAIGMGVMGIGDVGIGDGNAMFLH